MDIVYAIGLFASLYFFLRIGHQLLIMIKMVLTPNPFKMEKYGEWAVITGCTDGIGKEYCLQLAVTCSKFILIGRNQSKLDDVENELKAIRSDILIEQKIIDFSTFEDYSGLSSYLKDKNIGVFVNSVGVSFPVPQMLHDVKSEYPKLHSNLINVNIRSATLMTHMILKGMEIRRKGLVIFLSSGSSTQPMPMQAAYASGKKLLDVLALNLSKEYPNVKFQSVKPYYVATKMTQKKINWKEYSLMVPGPSEYVRQALGSVDDTNHISTHGYAPHCIQSWYSSRLPEFIIGNIVYNKVKAQRDVISKQA